MHVLLLNADNRPSAVLSWQKAIDLILRDVVYVIATYDNWIVRSVSQVFEVPSVLMLKKWVPNRKRITFNRTNVYIRDRYACQYCSKSVSSGGVRISDLTFDHVIPRSKGGLTSWTNIVTACSPCNHKKGDRTPKEAGITLRNPPVEPKTLSDLGFGANFPDMWKSFIGTKG